MTATPGSIDDPPDRSDGTTYFLGLSSLYARHRPSYPAEALAIALGPARHGRVLDVGCGTGIATRGLVALGARVTGLDPNEELLAAARGAPGAEAIDYRAGRAEATPFEDDAFDAITCCQTFQWLDADAALDEFRRILVSGGRLALIWNVRGGDSEREATTAEYAAIVADAQADAEARGLIVHRERRYDLDGDPRFAVVERASVVNPHRLSRDDFIGRARCASYFPRTGPVREALEQRLHRLFDARNEDGTLVLPQQTEVMVAVAR